jgi:choline dehydrogenase
LIGRYFRKLERYTPHLKYSGVNVGDRGDDGFLHTTHRFCHTESMIDSFISASEEIGIPYNPYVIYFHRSEHSEKTNPNRIRDINTKKGTLGATKFSTCVDPSGLRSSSATAYLSPSVIARQNLTVAVETQVSVFFSKKNILLTGFYLSKDHKNNLLS